MKIGIISDTHDHRENTRRAVQLFNEEQVALVVHAGDFVSPFIFRELGQLQSPLRAVFGNNDGDRAALRRLIAPLGTIAGVRLEFEAEGKRLLVVHDFGDAVGAGKPGAFDFIIFGHTHRAEVRREGTALLINPGECCGWLENRPTAAILDTASGAVRQLDLAAEPGK